MEDEKELYREAVTGVCAILRYLGEDPYRPGLQETPRRFLKAWKEDWGRGYNDMPLNVLRIFPYEGNERHYDELVVVRDISVYSTCEHHLAPFFGRATVGYIPDARGVVGLSKLARIVDHFSRRLQVQERLTNQIADYVATNISGLGVGVVIKATHLCMVSRGVSQPTAETVTSALRAAVFDNDNTRAEFLRLAGVR